MSKRFLNFCVFALLAAVAMTCGAPLDAQDDTLPPQVIDVWPLPGVELSPDQPLTLTFDEPMNQASVEAAFNIMPTLRGTFSWVDPRTVRFLPEGEWPRNTTLTAIVGAEAQSLDGIALGTPFQTDVETVGPLLVASVVPEPGTQEINADSRIVVSFDRPVVPLVSTADIADLPNPLTIEPAVEGQGEWINTSLYAFTPDEPLQGSTSYTVSVGAGLTSSDGALLDQPYQWSFRTVPPRIVTISPSTEATSVLLDQSVAITFNQPMDPTSTESALAIAKDGVPISGSFGWNDDSTEMTWTPDSPYQMQSTYFVNIAPTALSRSGQVALESGVSQSFTTVPYPNVEDTFPDNGAVDVNVCCVNASLTFNTPMNFNTFRDKIVISPEPETWYPETFEWDQQTLYLRFNPLANTTYTITVLAGVEDIYGNAVPTDNTFSFTTGAIVPDIYPVINGNFMITGAYRENTRFVMLASGAGDFTVSLYKVTEDTIGDAYAMSFDDYYPIPENTQNYMYSTDLPRWAVPDNFLRSWTQQYDTGNQVRQPQEVLLASETGGQLSPGLYWVITQSSVPAQYTGNDTFQFALAVANATLTVKRSPEETLVWVTDMQTSLPVANTNISIVHNGEVLASGQTDDEGIFHTPIALPYDEHSVYIFAESEGVFGAWYTNYVNELPTERGYVYTDRPVYRPGETVYYRGVLRDRHDMDFSVPDRTTIHIRVQNPFDDTQVYLETDLPVSEFGSFSGEFTIPDDVPLGDIAIVADFGDSVAYQYGYLGPVWNGAGTSRVSFTVAEFRVPEYEVTVTPQEESIIQGDPLNILGEARYYAGGGVSDAPISYNLFGEMAYFDYQGTGSYSFYDSAQEPFYYEQLSSGETRTDSTGRTLVTIEDTTAPVQMPMQITAEVTVTDESGQPISGRVTVLAHPSSVYVGLHAENSFSQSGQPIEADLITVTPDSVPVGGQTVGLEVIKQEWTRAPVEGQFGRYTWTLLETPIQSDSVTTAEDGTAHYSFTPSEAGIYRLRATTQDAQERQSASTWQFWVQGEGTVFWGQASSSIALVADKDQYVPGETARILIPISYTGRSTVLVSVERAGIMSYEVAEVEGTTFVYELPLTDEHAPTVYVHAIVVHGIDDETPNPDYQTGVIQLNVEPVRERLTVEAVPSSTVNPPRGTVSFDLTARDADGNPVQAEIGVALTDKAVLALMDPNSTTLEETFYGRQQDYVTTATSLTALLDRLTDGAFPGGRGGGGGGGGGGPLFAREDFVYTPLWEPHVVTDANGHATVSVELPDNLTTWKLDARAVTMSTEVGQTTTEIMSTLPLIVRPVAPRFFVVGDRVQLAAVINNNTGSEQTVQATLDAAGVTLESDATQTVTIAADSRARVEWMAVVQDVEGVDLTFSAIGENGYQDAAKPTLRTGPNETIPVYAYSAPDVTGTGGILREGGAATESIALPTRFHVLDGALQVTIDPSLAASTVDALDYLENFPHECIEQTVSRFLPNVVTYRALNDLGIQEAELEANLNDTLTASVNQLAAAQNGDGSWSWFAGMSEGDPLVTACAALGLIEARDAGFAFDTSMIDRAINYVAGNLVRPDLNTPTWQLNRQAFFLYVLSRDEWEITADLQALFAVRDRLTLDARAYLLMAADDAMNGDTNISGALISDFTNAAILSATGAHWEEPYDDWYNWTSDTRTTALILAALVRTQPDNPLLPNVVRWLMVARDGDHWETTQETAWAVIALTGWMQATGELTPNYEYTARFNEATIAEATVTPDTVRDQQTLRIDVADLLTDRANRLQIARSEGQGALYYSAHLDLRLPASEVEALSRGVTVSREYFLNGDPDQPVTSARIGDVVTVRLTLTLPEDMYYFTLEDPLPAGLESIDTSLNTTSQAVDDPTLSVPDQDDPFWYWGWWWFDRTELRDQQTNLYADFLPRGSYVYTYQTQATVAGEFQTMPAQGYAFYQPEVFGRSDGSLFTVEPSDAADE